LPVVAAWLALGLVGLGVGFLAGLDRPQVYVVPASLVLVGVVLGGRRWLELTRRRRAADRWLRTGASPTPLHRWRATELVSGRERRLLVRSLEDVVLDLRGSALPGAVPLDRVGVRPYEGEIVALADRLSDPARSVSPAGILLVQDFLTRPESPLYSRTAADRLPLDVARILDALDGGSRPPVSVRRLDRDERVCADGRSRTNEASGRPVRR
jgi:hypothetical protein